MKKPWSVAWTGATLLLLFSFDSPGQDKRTFPLRGVVANDPAKPLLAVRKGPPDVKASSYKLAEPVCSAPNGSEFLASQEIRLPNGEIWFKIDGFTKVMKGDCSRNGTSGWMIAKFKDQWAVKILEQNVPAATRVPALADRKKAVPSDPFNLSYILIGSGAVLLLFSGAFLFFRIARPRSRKKDAPTTTDSPRVEEQHPPESMPIFISYRRSDSADVTGRIYDRLVARFGKESVFKDIDSIPLGFDFRQHIESRVSACSLVLVVMGNQWLNLADSRRQNPDDYVRIEVEAALRRNIPVIPVLVQGARMPSGADLPSSLQELVYRNGLEVRSDPDFHKDVDRLIAGIVHIQQIQSRGPQDTRA